MNTRYFAASLCAAWLYWTGTVSARTGDTNSPNDWALISTPTHSASQSIGHYTSGCVSGAVPLPLNGTGYQVMRISRQRYYGHPNLIAFIEKLGRMAADEKLGTLLIGDLGQPRGGPMPNGHRSHQTGLDADIWFLLSTEASQRMLTTNERETWNATSVVDLQADTIDYRHWSTAHAKILEVAASQPEVDRIFVHPSIKQALCAKSSEPVEWLRKIRPWWKHDDHFHVRLHCPPNDAFCHRQDELPPGNGCDASLNWWFSAEAKQPGKSRPIPPPPLPALCEKVFSEQNNR